MNHPGKVFLTLTAALLLLCPQIFAQEPSGEAAPPPAEQTDQDEDTNQLLQQFEKAPTLEGGTQKLYHIRNVNIHGAQYIDNSILRASSGLIPGDSIYLPSNFISTAITRLWNQRLFSDIRVGATIEGDSLDLEVFLKERPRVNYWRFEGISKSNQKDLLEKLKLKRGTELSDYVIDKNSKLIHKYYADKGFRNAEVSVRIDNDSILKQAVNVTFIVDRKRKIKIGEINFTGNEEFSDKTSAPHLQENPPEKPQLLPGGEIQRRRFRKRQGAAARLLQFERFPQRQHRRRFDLRDQRQAYGYHAGHFGRQQVLHPQCFLDRQLGL